MLVDANLLLLAVDETSPWHPAASTWLQRALNDPRPVGIPWFSLTAFLRISTHPRVSDAPLNAEQAWSHVDAWLSSPAAWVPGPTERHADVFGTLVRKYQVTGNLVTDAHMAALAMEHGLTVCSADSDFARFPEVRWENPLV